MFFGFLKLLGFIANQIISLITKLIAGIGIVISWALKKVLEYLINKVLDSKFIQENVKTNYLAEIDPNGVSLATYFIALFHGFEKAIKT